MWISFACFFIQLLNYYSNRNINLSFDIIIYIPVYNMYVCVCVYIYINKLIREDYKNWSIPYIYIYIYNHGSLWNCFFKSRHRFRYLFLFIISEQFFYTTNILFAKMSGKQKVFVVSACLKLLKLWWDFNRHWNVNIICTHGHYVNFLLKCLS